MRRERHRPADAGQRHAGDRSEYDGYAFCDLPTQVYIGGYHRRPKAVRGNGTLTVDHPANLTNASGNTIPFSQISWTSSGNGDGNARSRSRRASFSSTSSMRLPGKHLARKLPLVLLCELAAFVAAGSYTGRVTYTLSAP